MDRIRLAYRDQDRTPVIFCIQEMARRHYDLDVEVLHVQPTDEYEAALFDDTCDVIIEHTEYLLGEPRRGKDVIMFCAPSISSDSYLVTRPETTSPEQIAGGTVAIRASGRPHGPVLRLRALGLEGRVQTVIVPDSEVGRWGQWKKVVSGECIATFMSPIYLPDALAGGLHLLPAPDIQVIGQFAQACRTAFATENDELFLRYVKSVIHALCLMKLRREEALEIARGEPMRRMKIIDAHELERQFDAIATPLQLKPYPTPQAILTSYEIAMAEYPGSAGLNPLTIWDLHWLKRLDDSGFMDGLIRSMGGSP
jgi:hypothetical protein